MHADIYSTFFSDFMLLALFLKNNVKKTAKIYQQKPGNYPKIKPHFPGVLHFFCKHVMHTVCKNSYSKFQCNTPDYIHKV